MSKKALSLFQDDGTDNLGGTPGAKSRDKKNRKSKNAEYYKQRFRKNFSQLLEEDAIHNPDPPNYLSAQAPASTKPKKTFMLSLRVHIKFLLPVLWNEVL